MSKERSPRELCSTTIGTRGIRHSFSTKPSRASLLWAVGGSERLLADLQGHPRRPAALERLADQREMDEQAMAPVHRAAEVERVERLAARLGCHPGSHEEVARDDHMLARVDVARVQ